VFGVRETHRAYAGGIHDVNNPNRQRSAQAAQWAPLAIMVSRSCTRSPRDILTRGILTVAQDRVALMAKVRIRPFPGVN
jgi:hypothetical protein